MSVLENRFQGVKKTSNLNWLWYLAGTIIFSALVLLLALYWIGYFGARPNEDAWQAVFLTNGQVYFGKLETINRNFVVLTNIYYLQVSRPLQQPENAQQDEQQPNLNLIKLGDELHGPEDAMYIERKNIMFWENLKNNSNVVRAIEEAR